MRILKVRIVNFANFQNLEVETGANLVIVGENKVGKSKAIWTLHLVLDRALSKLAVTSITALSPNASNIIGNG